MNRSSASLEDRTKSTINPFIWMATISAFPIAHWNPSLFGCKGEYDAVKKIVSEHAPYIKVKRAEIVPYHYQLQIINPEPDPEREAILQKRSSQST